MEKRVLLIVVAIVVVALLVFAVYRFTGLAVTGPVGACSDTDGGDDKYVKGTASYANRDTRFTDLCYARSFGTTEKYLKEYYCLTRVKSKRYFCANGCINGACVK